jgi:hypothetical protein
MHLRRSHAAQTSRSSDEPAQPAPLFAALELVNVFYPSSDERAALKAVSDHPPVAATNGHSDRVPGTAPDGQS